MKKRIFIKALALCVLASLSSCRSKRLLVSSPVAKNIKTVSGIADREDPNRGPALAVKKLTFVQKVSDNRVYASNIVGRMTFYIQSEDKNVTLPGYIRMRKDQVIRLQLCIPLVGTEVARIDFYPDSVLILDRYHKKYVKASYNQVPFLQRHGISFYSLQALFWNQLLLPGSQKVTESDLKKFDVNLDESSQDLPVTYKQGKMNYQWMADRMTGRINKMNINYASSHVSLTNLNVNYSNFQSVGVKWFPATQNYTFNTNANQKVRTVKMNIEMSGVTTADKWETRTHVPDRYKQVPAGNVLDKIMNM